MAKSLNILLVGDSKEQGRVIAKQFLRTARLGPKLTWKQFLEGGLERFEGANINALVLDLDSTEIELNEALKETVRTLAGVPVVFAALAHELKTPLSVIAGYSEILKKMDPSSPRFIESLNIISRNAYIGSRIVSDTLDVPEKQKKKDVLNYSKFSLDHLIHSAIQSFDLIAKSKDIFLQREKEERLGSCVGDEVRICQVIWNLLSNAIKFTPPGGWIKLYAIKSGEMFEISVEDSGKGIDPSHLAFVFRRFWRADPLEGLDSEGMGLGLSIVKAYVEMHGGQVRVESDGLGRGSKFTIMIPTKPPSQEERDQRGLPEKHPDFSVEGLLKGKAILLVDDDEASRMFMQSLLEAAGARVSVASGGEEGLDQAKQSDWDCLVCDIKMEGISGYELVTRLRDWEREMGKPRVTAVALTAFGASAHLARARQAGFSEFFEKPIRGEHFVMNLHRLLVVPSQKPKS